MNCKEGEVFVQAYSEKTKRYSNNETITRRIFFPSGCIKIERLHEFDRKLGVD